MIMISNRKLNENYYSPMCYWAHMITFKCTGNCPFCIVDGRGKHAKFDELSGKEILDWWNNVEHYKGQRLSLIGGETTMHKDIVEIVNNLENYNITVTTNCTGPFYQDYYFFNKFKPKSNSTLRINTSFHPHAIEPEDYIGRVRAYRHVGHNVDQVAYVNTPEVWKYQDKINKVSNAFGGGIKSPPYLGFYDITDGFKAPFFKDYLLPNESYPDQEGVRNLCGIKDYDWYRTVCGSGVKKEVFCPHGGLSLIIGPNGNYYPCHYKLYYDIDPICNIKDFVSIDGRRLECRHFGYCNWCDIPRLEFGKENLKVSGAEKDWLKPVTIEYKDISDEVNRPEIKYVIEDMKNFYKENNLYTDDIDLFRCASALLYSGQRHRCDTLVVDNPVFASYLRYKGYNVKEEYKEEDEFEFIVVFNDEDDPRKSNLSFLLSKRGCPSVIFYDNRIEIKVKN